jgi:D-serine deaminase-like pyridoxal phosphate-dependent protein
MPAVDEQWRLKRVAFDPELVAGRGIREAKLPTPFVYVDLDILESNIASIAEAADKAGFRLRPHVKTHKIAEIARLQLAAGASGLTVAKLSEAEALIKAGITTEYLVAHPFWNAHQIATLFETDANVIVSVDSLELSRRFSDAATLTGTTSRQVVVVDTGYHRFGVPPPEAIELALRIAELPAVEVLGIRSHAGHVYNMRDPGDRVIATANEIAQMSQVASGLQDGGVGCKIVSIGSTPAADAIFNSPDRQLVNEVRPGNYVFFDRIMVSLGVVRPEQCALRIVCEVVATHRGKSFIDGGKLTFSSTTDPFARGYGTVVGYDDAVIETLSQESATISAQFKIGQRIVVIPNHACEITNLAPMVFYGRGDLVEGIWGVDARASVW